MLCVIFCVCKPKCDLYNLFIDTQVHFKKQFCCLVEHKSKSLSFSLMETKLEILSRGKNIFVDVVISWIETKKFTHFAILANFVAKFGKETNLRNNFDT